MSRNPSRRLATWLHAIEVVGVLVGLLALGWVGLSRLELGLFPLGWFPPKDPMRQTFAAIDGGLGGSNELRILIEPTRGTTADRYGNLIHRRASRNFNPLMAMAADLTIAEVASVVDAVAWIRGGAPVRRFDCLGV